jgi:hypothetical protein
MQLLALSDENHSMHASNLPSNYLVLITTWMPDVTP